MRQLDIYPSRVNYHKHAISQIQNNFLFIILSSNLRMKQNEPFYTRLIEVIKHSPHQEYISYFFVLISSLCWALIWVYPNEHNINTIESNLIRGIILTAGCYGVCKMMDYPTDFQNSEENKWLYIRNVPMIIHAFSLALVQFILPLPLVHTICSAGNLFVFLFDFWLYGVKITRKQAAGILLGFMGVLAIILGRPITHWLFKDLEDHTDFQNYLTDDPIIIGIVTALFTGELAIWAFGVVVIKRLKHSNAIQINYHQGIIIVISCGLAYPFYESKTSLTEIITCFLINILPVLGGQSLFIAALTMSKNLGMITMITFTSVIVSYLLSIFRYHETQNIICTCGVVLVVVGLAKALFYK